MKIQLIGDAIVIKSAVLAKDLQDVLRYNSKAATLVNVDEDNNRTPVFKMSFGPSGGLNKNGVVFDSTDDAGFAQTTMVGPSSKSMQERVEHFSTEYAMQLAYANRLEAQIIDAVSGIAAATEVAKESIEVLG